MIHHGPRPGGGDDELPVVALIGRPNVGKSTFLGRATGRFVETANAPGTTVMLDRRLVDVRGRRGWLVDLPGTRSLGDDAVSGAPFWRLLGDARPDALLVVVDAGDLARHLPLALACRDLGLPIVIAANLADEAAARGIEVDVGRLSQLFAAPIHLTNGRAGIGVDAAVVDALRLAEQRIMVRQGARSPRGTGPASIYPPAEELALADETRRVQALRSVGAAVADPTGLHRLLEFGVASPRGVASLALAARLEPPRWDIAEAWARQVEWLREVPPRLADRVANLVTSPWPGIPVFAAVTALTFLVLVLVGGWLATALSEAWVAIVSPPLGTGIETIAGTGPLATALVWAFDGGLLSMIAVGVPYVATFYLLLAILEDSGYLTSAAVLLDRVFNAVGLPGRAAVPLLAAAGCNVPAIYGTRVLRTRRERLLGSFLVTLTPCSARTAVVVAALAPFAGVGAALAAFAVAAGVTLAAGIGANTLIPGRQPNLVLELAPLRRPIALHVVAKAWSRFRGFVVMATPIMLVGSFVLGLIWESGAWDPVAAAIAPLATAWLGLPPITAIAIAFAFLRKELALQLLVALVVIEYGVAGADLGAVFSAAQLFVFAIVTTISVPCAATLAALVQELGARAAAGISLASIALALVAGGVVARVLGIA
ncbi:MAG: ferrous iron transporter B [Chloroflexi bacterium]|nr:ferrous iron transporter B [Chloroflexota bacterium]